MVDRPVSPNTLLEKGFVTLEATPKSIPLTSNALLDKGYVTLEAQNQHRPVTPNTLLDMGLLAILLGPHIRDHVPFGTRHGQSPWGFVDVAIDATSIGFELFTNTPRTVDGSTIVVQISINFGALETAYDGGSGGYQTGYSGTVTSNSTSLEDFITFLFDRDDGFNYEDHVRVFVFGDDDLSQSIDPPEWFDFTIEEALSPTPPGEVIVPSTFPLDMYRFLIAPIPEADHKDGNLFLKRYLDGPNDVWKTIVAGLQNIPKLWSVGDTADAHLQFLKNIVGWTPELELITDRLDDAGLRRLIAASGALWRERGPENAILNVLRIVSGGVRMRIWNWFDFRWIIDETELGEEHEGQDPWIVDAPSESRDPQPFSSLNSDDVERNAEYFSNLRIVDDETLDRQLVKDVLNLMRAANERFDITYVDFLDLFQSPGDNQQWDLTTVDFTVVDGLAKLSNDTILEETTAIVTGSSAWTQYVYFARIRGNVGTAGAFGLLFYHQDFDNTYMVVIDTVTQDLSLQKRVGGSPNIIDNIDLGTAEINILEDVFYTIRVEVVEEGGSNRILVFVDGSQLISTLDSQFAAGTVGIFHTTDATLECSEVEVFELPVDSETLEINS